MSKRYPIDPNLLQDERFMISFDDAPSTILKDKETLFELSCKHNKAFRPQPKNEQVDESTLAFEEKCGCISVKEAADLLDCSTSLIYDLIKNGRLQAIRISSQSMRIRKVDLHQFILNSITTNYDTPSLLGMA